MNENQKNRSIIPSYRDILHLFDETVLTESDNSYIEFDELVDEWRVIQNTELINSDTEYESQLNRLRLVLEFVSKYSVDTKSPFFISKLYSGSDSLSLLADMLISYYNTNVHVYSVSPVFTMAEHLIVDRISNLIDPSGYGDGLFLPGGSYCNLVGLIAARHFYDQSTKTAGMVGQTRPLKIITSTRSHYSIEKAAIMMGIGLDNVIKVDYDKISTEEFEKILNSNSVFAVCTTFGTTSEGVLESIERFRPLLNRYKIWHHIDACVGGVLVYSDRCNEITGDLRKADSIGMDFHKIANIAVQCSALMINKSKSHVLKDVTNVNADYLFHADDDNHDISSISFQCGRKADGFRLFIYDSMIDLSLRVNGFLDRVIEFKNIIKSDDRFESYEGNSNITHVLFTPKAILDNEEDENKINKKIGQIIRALRIENIFLEYHDTYVRLVPINPQLSEVEFHHILNRIDYYASIKNIIS
jgi:glutamate decarboxylase